MGLDVYLANGKSAKEVTYGEGEEAETYTEYEEREYYLRSSYNDSGFNSVTERVLGLYGYYWVFEKWIGDGSQYNTPCTDPEVLDECLARAVELDALWQAAAQTGVFSCFAVTSILGEQAPASDTQAMAAFRTEQERWADPKMESRLFDAYGNRYGYFNRVGMTVHAVIPGTQFSSPCAYVVFKMGDEGVAYYLEAAKKAVELITEAKAMLEAGDTPVLLWSA